MANDNVSVLLGLGGGNGPGASVTPANVLSAMEGMDAQQQSDARAAIGATDALTSIPDDVKQALLNCFSKCVWIDEHGQAYYDQLSTALYLGPLVSISAVFTQGEAVIHDTDSLDVLRQYLVVTAHYAVAGDVVVTGYELSGTLTAGSCTITASYGGKTTTFSVTVTNGTLYSLENYAFSNERIIPGVATFTTADKDLTVALDITLATLPSSGTGSTPVLINLANDSSGFAMAFAIRASDNTAYWMAQSETIGSRSSGRTRIILTHEKNSGSMKCYLRQGTGDVQSVTVTQTFATSSKQFSFGQGTSGANVLPTGTINKAAIYDYVLSDYAIDKFLSVGGE